MRPRVFERGVPRPIYVCSHCKRGGHLREFCFKLGYVSRFASTRISDTHAPTHDSLHAPGDYMREFAHLGEQVKFLVKTSQELMEVFHKLSPPLENPSAPND